MVFNSFVFVLFFLVVYGLYVILRHRAQNVLLLVASYVFYGWWDWRFLSLVFASTLLDYVCGLKIVDDPVRRKLWIGISMTGNLGLLFFFKYFNFFAASTAALLHSLGLEAGWTTLNIVLPVGISFYTFQTMSYTLDIYRGTLAPTRSLLNFSLYVAFFPQLVAGPIERASHLLPQVEKPRRPTYQGLREGFWLILHGYLLKVVVADNLGPFADEIFNHPESARGLAVPLALAAFAFQIYGDFAGYSNIARGLCKWMGFDLMVNFRMPYFATNPSDFWRRWHISLSTWLRDYLYIPLGGNRGGPARTHRNLLLTMVLGGLWHGAAWHFVAWGLYHGLLLSGHRLLQPLLDRLRPAGRLARGLWHSGSVLLFLPHPRGLAAVPRQPPLRHRRARAQRPRPRAAHRAGLPADPGLLRAAGAAGGPAAGVEGERQRRRPPARPAARRDLFLLVRPHPPLRSPRTTCLHLFSILTCSAPSRACRRGVMRGTH
ncbi:MAG: MBOAT family O-acyltransferase [Kiritimatiellia bacterium]